MDRQQKNAFVEEQKQAFQDSQSVVVFHYRGSTVSEMTAMRQEGYDKGVSIKVTKNSLTKIALKDTPLEGLTEFFSGPTAVAYANDSVSAAKIVSDAAKENDKLKIVGGAMGEKILSIADIDALSNLPTLDELRSKIIGVISAPATKVAQVTQAPAGKLARVFAAYGNNG